LVLGQLENSSRPIVLAPSFFSDTFLNNPILHENYETMPGLTVQASFAHAHETTKSWLRFSKKIRQLDLFHF